MQLLADSATWHTVMGAGVDPALWALPVVRLVGVVCHVPRRMNREPGRGLGWWWWRVDVVHGCFLAIGGGVLFPFVLVRPRSSSFVLGLTQADTETGQLARFRSSVLTFSLKDERNQDERNYKHSMAKFPTFTMGGRLFTQDERNRLFFAQNGFGLAP